MIDLNKYAEEIHENAEQKGWWENGPRSFREIRKLAVSEISEATECVRNKEPFCWQEHVSSIKDVFKVNYDGSKAQVEFTGTGRKIEYGSSQFIDHPLIKPEGESVELVDAVIRLLDFSAANHLDLRIQEKQTGIFLEDFQFNSIEFHDYFCEILYVPRPGEVIDVTIESFISVIIDYFYQRGWPFEDILKLKMEYNKTRPHRHGGKLY